MDTNHNELFWNASIESIKKGYTEDNESLVCLICGEQFVKGEIYQIEGRLYEAYKAASIHFKEKHGSMAEYMISKGNAFLGITEIQKELLGYLVQGDDDKTVAQKMGIHPSTVRNHRYRLREKEKQAKLFCAFMEMLQETQKRPMAQVEDTKLHETSKTATMVDDRYNTTQSEREKILKSYFDETGRIKNYPAKEKRKIIVLEQVSTNFKKGKIYSEIEMNRILARLYDDHATLRRALIEYGFMERDHEGNHYWIKE